MKTHPISMRTSVLVAIFGVVAICILVIIVATKKETARIFSDTSSEMSELFGLTETYTQATAVRLGYVAYAAYYADIDPNEMQKWLGKSQLQTKSPKPFKDASTEIVGFVTQVGTSSLLVAFTGTQLYNLPETVLDDLDIWKSNYIPTGGNVSDGFFESWSSVRNDVVSTITPAIKEIWFVGHSLGGAVATLGCADIKHTYPNIKVVSYTYASPRVGNQDFTNGYQRLGITTNRVQNYWDIIPRLPIAYIGYVHVDTLILLYSDGIQSTCVYNAAPPNDYLKDPFDWAYEHSLTRYLGLLESCTS